MEEKEAIELMKEVINVQDWNERREFIKNNLTPDQWTNVYKIIDTEGMCVKTIKKNVRTSL